MYSLVLMAALSTGTQAPDCGCWGGCGYWGSYYGWGWGGYSYWPAYYGYGWYGYYPYGWGYTAYTPVVYTAASKKIATSDRARVLVHVPQGVRLKVNGVATKATSADRHFVTPRLKPGKVYRYTLTAEATRDGEPVTATETITVQAGRQTEVTLSLPATGVAGR